LFSPNSKVSKPSSAAFFAREVIEFSKIAYSAIVLPVDTCTSKS
jgi:hypothetical protein